MSKILEKIIEKKHFAFLHDQDLSWQEAVRLSTLPLVEDGSVSRDYYKQIVECIEKHGPYVVLEHNIAMPHTTENAEGAYKTAVGLLICDHKIVFGTDEDGEKKEANLLFTLSAVNMDEHMENIVSLMDVFMNDALIDALATCRREEELVNVIKKNENRQS